MACQRWQRALREDARIVLKGDAGTKQRRVAVQSLLCPVHRRGLRSHCWYKFHLHETINNICRYDILLVKHRHIPFFYRIDWHIQKVLDQVREELRVRSLAGRHRLLVCLPCTWVDAGFSPQLQARQPRELPRLRRQRAAQRVVPQLQVRQPGELRAARRRRRRPRRRRVRARAARRWRARRAASRASSPGGAP